MDTLWVVKFRCDGQCCCLMFFNLFWFFLNFQRLHIPPLLTASTGKPRSDPVSALSTVCLPSIFSSSESVSQQMDAISINISKSIALYWLRSLSWQRFEAVPRTDLCSMVVLKTTVTRWAHKSLSLASNSFLANFLLNFFIFFRPKKCEITSNKYSTNFKTNLANHV